VTQGVPPEIGVVIEEACKLAGVALIEVHVRGADRQLRMEITVDGLAGVTHEHCRAVSRALDERLETDDFYGRLRAVDVSSPGADAPVKFLWQLTKSIGRTVSCTLNNGNKVEGKLESVSDESLALLVTPKSKKETPSSQKLEWADITNANVVLKF